MTGGDVGLHRLPWFPAGWAEDEAEPVTPAARVAEVPGDRHVFVGLQLPDVVGVHLLGQPVVRPELLGLEASEQPVPDDQDAAVVPVEVDLVHTVVHPVVRRGVEDEFDWPPELPDAFGVDPVLVDQVDGEAGEHHPRRHAEQWQQCAQEHVAADVPLLPKRGREVEVLAGVVRLMRRPEQAHPVCHPVIPVIEEVDADDGDHPRVPGVRRKLPRCDVDVERRVADQSAIPFMTALVPIDTTPIQILAHASGLR